MHHWHFIKQVTCILSKLVPLMVFVPSLSFLYLPVWKPFFIPSTPLLLPRNRNPSRPIFDNSIANLKPQYRFLIIFNMMQDPIGIPTCFSAGEKPEDAAAVTKSGQSVFMSVYKTNIADQPRLITVTWCKNLLLHGLSVSVNGPEAEYTCKVELKPWNFWRKQGSKSFTVDGKALDVFWDLKAAKFQGETEPISEYYVAVVSGEEVVLSLGDLKKDAYRKTGCRPALIDPVLVSRKEHVFGKKRFQTRVKFHEKGRFHEISIECKNRSNGDGVDDSEMEIRIDGDLVIHVKHLQWKFRGNDSINFNKVKIEVYWDVHDWLFSPGLRNALFIIKPTSPAPAPAPVWPSQAGSCGSVEGLGYNPSGSYEFCLFLYAWKVE